MNPQVSAKPVRVGLVGYGGAFKMGMYHHNFMVEAGVFETVAVCDVDPACLAQAKADFGEHIRTYRSLGRMLAADLVDMCVIITPHNTHYKLAVQCLQAGKHVVVEKPMCITYAEAMGMIEAARKHDRMLSVFHNRRWDGQYLTIKKCLADGLLGDIFHIEAFHGGFSKPRDWWRSIKKISGGSFYDWGAHFLDWTLGLVPEAKMVGVTGFYHENVVWKNCTNEDQAQVLIRFDTGCVADVQMSEIAYVPRATWRILGTKGAIEDWWRDSLTVHTQVKGYPAKMEIKYQEGRWADYYRNIGDHLTKGAELIVKPEQSARTIAIMECAEKSAKQGQTLKPPCP